jgi:hypothetical protein
VGDKEIDLTINIMFSPSFTGRKNVWQKVYDHASQTTGWVQVGTWVVGERPDFNLSVGGPSPVTLGSSAMYLVQMANYNGFAEAITLSASNLPPGVSATFNPPTLSPSSWSSWMTLSTTSGTQAVTSTFTVSGASSSMSHNATGTLVVQDFSIGISPGSANTLPGGNASYTVSVTPINGFNGPVSFSAPTGATFTPATVTGGGSTLMTITTSSGASAGISSLTVSATSGSLSRPAQASLNVQDFSITGVSPGSQTVVSGGTTSYSITMAAQSGFAGPLNFSVSRLPTGAAAAFSPPTLTGGGTTVLSVSTVRPSLFTRPSSRRYGPAIVQIP